jgi:CYTH domain-containing protein
VKEIERKFLVDHSAWIKQVKTSCVHITQAYLQNSKEQTTRLRLRNDKAYLTIKGPTLGLTRNEYEYEIPFQEAEQMILDFKLKVLKKRRYLIDYASKIWEVDVFEDELNGLIIAEIELESEKEIFEKPAWVGEEVSYDSSYFNANLINRLL